MVDVDVDQGREEWCDLFFKILLLFFKILLFAIKFLRFEAHLSCALFGGRFSEETDFLFDGFQFLAGSGFEVRFW